jgi:hypothetical protein
VTRPIGWLAATPAGFVASAVVYVVSNRCNMAGSRHYFMTDQCQWRAGIQPAAAPTRGEQRTVANCDEFSAGIDQGFESADISV